MAREHVNPCNNLVAIMKHYYKDSIISDGWYPLRIPAIDLNLFYVCHIQKKEG